MAPPAPSSGRPRGRRRRESKNKSRVDEVGGEKMTTHPLIFHNLLCEGPQTLIFVAAPPPPPLNIPKVVICIVIVVVVVCVFVVL